MVGLFMENGPIRMKRHENGTIGVYSVESSWTDDAHVVFVD